MAWILRQLRAFRDTYGLPREMPVVARLLILMLLTGIPLPLIWWLAAPVSPVVVAIMLFFELVIVFGGLWRVLTANTFSSLPDRRPMQPPSIRPLDRPATDVAASALSDAIPVDGPRQAVAGHPADGRRRVLIVASEAVTAKQVHAALGGRERGDRVEVMVIAPALHRSALRFWLSDADDAIRKARDVQAATVAGLRSEGMPVTGDSAEGDVTQAIQDALVTFPADRILVFAHDENNELPHEHVNTQALSTMANVPVELHRLAA